MTIFSGFCPVFEGQSAKLSRLALSSVYCGWRGLAASLRSCCVDALIGSTVGVKVDRRCCRPLCSDCVGRRRCCKFLCSDCKLSWGTVWILSGLGSSVGYKRKLENISKLHVEAQQKTHKWRAKLFKMPIFQSTFGKMNKCLLLLFLLWAFFIHFKQSQSGRWANQSTQWPLEKKKLARWYKHLNISMKV